MAWWLTFLGLVVSYQLPAQVLLDEIEVGAVKDLEEFSFSASSVISADELETGSSSLIDRKLETIPGIIATQNGGPGGRVSYFIRGTESRHISFTLDGLKLNDPSGPDRQFDAAFISAPFLKEIIVHRGPQAVLYGSDAFGGLVEMRSRKGELAQETRLNLRGGSFGTVDASLSRDWLSGTSQGTLSWNQFRTDGISRLNEKRFAATERDGADITNVTSSSTHAWGGKYKTDVLAAFINGRNQLDGALTDNSFDESQSRQYILQQKSGLDFGEDGGITLRNGISRHQRSFQTILRGDEFYSGDLIQHELLYKFESQYFSFLSGIQTEHESLEIVNLRRSFDLHSLFLQGSLRLENWKLQSGLRGDYHTAYHFFQAGSTGISYDLHNSTLSLQYSQGYKAPTLYQLYASPFGNSQLDPEENISWEGRWTFKSEALETEMAVFQNRMTNLIIFGLNQGFINQSKFIAEGVELSARLRNNIFELRPSYTHQNFREHETTVLRRPRNYGQMSFLFFPTPVTECIVKTRWFGPRFDLDESQNRVKLNSFEVVDLAFRWTRGDSDYGIEFLNLFNREYEEIYGFNVMPRAIFVSTAFRL